MSRKNLKKNNMWNQIEWRVMVPSMIGAAAIPTIDIFLRFMIPILSGVVWVFLRPKVEQWRKNQLNKKNNKKIEKL